MRDGVIFRTSKAKLNVVEVNVKRLDLSRNALSQKGISALRKKGIQVVADDQWDPSTQPDLGDSDEMEEDWE